MYVSLFLLAFAVSIDGFGVGITYGLRKISLPWWSLLIVTTLAVLMILLAMGIGSWLVSYISATGAKRIGALILIGIGGWALYNVFANKEQSVCEPREAPQTAKVFRWELKQFGIVIQILKTPSIADLDRSGSISPGEAFILGLALSMDAFGAGLGAAFVGYPHLQTAFAVSLSSWLFISLGLKIGFKYAHSSLIRQIAYVPGVLLILIGLSKIFI